jgi:hypothetical protein
MPFGSGINEPLTNHFDIRPLVEPDRITAAADYLFAIMSKIVNPDNPIFVAAYYTPSSYFIVFPELAFTYRTSDN